MLVNIGFICCSGDDRVAVLVVHCPAADLLQSCCLPAPVCFVLLVFLAARTRLCWLLVCVVVIVRAVVCCCLFLFVVVVVQIAAEVERSKHI